MQASLIICVCSETLMLLALQHRKLRHHFYVITLDIFALSFFFLSKHSNSKQSPKYPWNASLSHCSSAPYLPGLCAPRYTCLPGRFCCLAPICSKRCQEDRSQRWDPALATSTPQHGSQQGGYLGVWGHWGQVLNFSLDFAAFVNYWIDGAAHGRLTALLALGKKTRQQMAPGFGGWQTDTGSLPH